ncbi:MAG: maleylpyruvate isomerase family mycothiol-dependent enzyme [Marmoricola sp.]|nr:maleylpyruvate isomerase family mycothiol-dependent enzyme [Marmoricola sp.]
MTDHNDPPARTGLRRLFGRRGISERRELDEELALDIDLDFSEYVEGIRVALAGFTDYARRAGMDHPVPTTPEWNVRQLLVHQGMVHRWAIANLLDTTPDVAAYEAEGLGSADPVTWLREGGLRLVETLQDAPEDLEAVVFLNNAPAPRQFWARRQCHETTIHSVDAQAAALGRMPQAQDTEITRAIALDGIDELLTGFLTREKSRLRSEQPIRIAVLPTDVDRAWTVHVSREPPVVERHHHGHADVVLKAPAEVLYLALWNRTDELTTDGFEIWRDLARVTWA